jgi:hypothetical protein
LFGLPVNVVCQLDVLVRKAGVLRGLYLFGVESGPLLDVDVSVVELRMQTLVVMDLLREGLLVDEEVLFHHSRVHFVNVVWLDWLRLVPVRLFLAND